MTAYRIRHVNNYRYQVPVVTSHHQLHLTPHAAFDQVIRRQAITVSVAGSVQHSSLDTFGNAAAHIEINTPYSALNITAFSEVDVKRMLPQVECFPLAWDSPVAMLSSVEQYRWNSPYIKRAADVRAYTAISFPPGRSLAAGFFDFVKRIYADFTYDPIATDIATPVATVLQHKKGVCQDFAHLAIAGLRSIGLPAAYISGYLETMPPAGAPRLIGADASHAWLAVWHPEIGWLQGDPTNGCLIAQRHVVLGLGRDFSDVSPITGVIFGGGTQQLQIAVDVVPEKEWAQCPWCNLPAVNQTNQQ